MLLSCGFREVEIIGERGLVSKIGNMAYNAANIVHSRIAAGRRPLEWTWLSTD
jgi:hypothetical protein